MSLINEALNKMPTNNNKIKFNIPMITSKNITMIEFPKIKKANFKVEEEGEIVKKDLDIEDINIETLGNMKSKEIKQIANKLGIYDTKGGDDKLIRKILDKLETIQNYTTF